MNKDHIDNYLKLYNRKEAAAWLLEKRPEEAAKVVAQADELMRNCFVFQDTWDMEPCLTPYTLEPMVWDKSPNGDPEWIFMLNRHDYLHKLLLAYWFTDRKEYVEKLKEYLFHWIDENPIRREGGVTIRTIDTGIRCMSWIPILVHLYGEGLVSEEEKGKILKSMQEQFVYLRESYVGKYTLSNWGVLQTTAICTAGLWFGEELGLKGTKEQDGQMENGDGELWDLEVWAWRELEEQLDLQILEDGAHWEQSIMYHMEVLNACARLWHSCHVFKQEFAHGWLADILRRMRRYVQFAAAPDHNQVAQGDSDVTDVRDVLTRAAVLFEDGVFRYGGFDRMDVENVWLFGTPGIRIYEGVKEKEPVKTSGIFPDAGAMYLRSGWDEAASYTCLFNGPLGSSHGHVDQTHVSLYYQGKPFLADCGRYSYVEEEPLRPWLKSAYAHNVCVIDDDPHGKPVRSWEYEAYGDCMKNYYREKGILHYGEMAYAGKLSSGGSYLAGRKVVVIDPDIWLFFQDIRCDGTHTVREYYHLDSQVEARRLEGGEIELSHSGTTLMLDGKMKFEIGDGVLSKCYNELESHGILTGTSQWKDRFLSWTSVTAKPVQAREAEVFQYHMETPADGETVTALDLFVSGELTWTVIVFHQETYQGGKVFYCHGVPVYGKIVILKKSQGGWERTRLRT